MIFISYKVNISWDVADWMSWASLQDRNTSTEKVLGVVCGHSVWQDIVETKTVTFQKHGLLASCCGCSSHVHQPTVCTSAALWQQTVEKALAALTFLTHLINKCGSQSVHSSCFCVPGIKKWKSVSEHTLRSNQSAWRPLLSLYSCASSFFWANTKQTLDLSAPPTLGADLSAAVFTLTTYSKTRVRVSLVWMMSWRSTMLACFRPFRRDAADTQRDTVRDTDTHHLHYRHHYNSTEALDELHHIQRD